MKNLPLILFLFVTLESKAQLPFYYGNPLQWHYDHHNYVPNYFAIDTLNGDTIKITKTAYFRINLHSDTLETLIFDNTLTNLSCRSDEGYWLTGHFHKIYPDKKTAEAGTYICNEKVDEWFYYYPNGRLWKYENYYRPLMQEDDHMHGSLFGIYKEYYENGNTRTYGSYKIIFKYVPYLIFNPNTYKDEEVCCKWIMQSVKDGTWITINPKGKIISRKRYFTRTDNRNNIMDLPDIITSQNKIGNDTIDQEVYFNFYKRK